MNRTLKVLFFVGILFASIQYASAQVTYTALANGDPTNLSNWDDGGGGNPVDFAQGDYFIIPSGVHLTLNSGTWALSDALLTGGLGLEIESGASLTFNGSATMTFPTSATQPHTFNMNGDFVYNSTTLLSRTVIEVTGAFNNNYGAATNFTFGQNQTYTSGTLQNAVKFGNLILSSGVTVTIIRQITLEGSLDLNSGSTLIMTNGALVGTSFTGQTGTGTFRTSNATNPPFPANQTWAGTIELNRAGAQFIPAGTYTNINATGGARTLNTGIISISGTFTPGSGAYTVNSSNTMNFNGSGAQSIPVLPSADYRNLTVTNSGRKSLSGNVTVVGVLSVANAGGILAINGNTLNLQGTVSIIGSLAGSSTSNLTVSGTTGGATGNLRFNTASATDTLLNTFTLNRTGASSATSLGSNVAITNLLQITNGNLDLNGRVITLKSTSISNTAQVGTVAGTITYNNGSFTVERFIPQGNRAVRDLAVGVNTNSNVYFFDTWQEAGGTASGLGTHITGRAGASPGGVDATTGCDMTTSGATSLWDYVNGVWSSGVTNTKTTKPNVYKGYRITVRGDRTFNLYGIPPVGMNAATTLRANGQLVTGTVTYTTSGTSNSGLSSTYSLNTNNSNGDYSFLGNPYVAAINWSTIGKTNLSNTYTVYDPTLGTSGAYVTWDGDILSNSNPSSFVNQYIQPYQGFFIQTTAASPQLVIAESDKATGIGLTSVFRTNATVSKISFTLSKPVSSVNRTMDGCVVAFDPAFDNGVNTNDAAKFSNGTENMSLFTNSKDLSIEHRKLPLQTDTLALRLWNVVNNMNYTITIDGRNFNSAYQAYLIDKLNNTERAIKTNDTTLISFTANTANTLSFSNRFYVVFRNNNALPLTTIALTATTKNNGVEVNWNTTNEVQVQSFEIERADDANTFAKIATAAAKNNPVNNYSIFDKNITTGVWYYRIKIINQDGSFKYSNTVAVNLNFKNEQLIVYPNPVKGKHFTLQLNNLKSGNYTVEMYNTAGQLQLAKKLTQVSNAAIASFVVDWDQNLSAGNYSVVVRNGDGLSIVKTIIIE